jgi:hypothetical protein
VDINANKQGKFIPITGHEIIEPIEMAQRQIKYIIVTNSFYYIEIKHCAHSIDRSIELIELEKIMTHLPKF